MAEKEVLIDWIKKHKKKLIFAGVSVPVILAFVIGIKNRDELINIWKSIIKHVDGTSKKIIDTTISADWDNISVPETMNFKMSKRESNLIDVRLHIRNLPEGWKPSEEKIMSAIEMGYELKPSQTWVEPHTKRRFAA